MPPSSPAPPPPPPGGGARPPGGVEAAAGERGARLGVAHHLPGELDHLAAILQAAPTPRRRAPGRPPLLAWHHASSHTTLRSFGSWVWMSSASPGESCALSAANTAPVTSRASRSEPSPASCCTRA